MKLVPLGVGDAFSARWYSSCLLLESDGRRLLVDCPHPIRKMMREACASAGLECDIGDIEGVVLTHLHADHCSGLEGAAYYYHFALGRRLPLYAHPSVSARLWQSSLAAGMEQLLDAAAGRHHAKRLEDYFDLRPLDFGGARHAGPFRIECRPTVHHVPTTALRISAAGKSLGYSADTAFDPALVHWLSQADRFVHETNYGAHTPYDALAALPAEVRERMWLIHYPDDFHREGSVVEPLCQGALYEM